MSDNREDIIIEADDDMLQTEVVKNAKPYLVFMLSDEHYCVPVHQVKEVTKFSETTRVPNTPEFIVGAVNLRGEIIAVVDIRYFFGLPEREKNEEAMIIVTDITGSPIGLFVDAVEGTIGIEEKAIQPPLATLKGELQKHTTGQIEVDKRIIVMLDLDKVLKSEPIENLKKERG